MTLPRLLALAAAVLLAPPSLAQTRELRQDRRERRQDRRETRDDARDQAAAASLLARYDAAAARGDGPALGALDAEALRRFDAELTEGRREVRRDAAEVARAGAEVREGGR